MLPFASSAKHPGVIYGVDNRVDMYGVFDTKIHTLAHATVGIIGPKAIENRGNGRSRLKTKKLKDVLKVCPDERFAEQDAAIYCTGFLVSPDTLLTAGHCIETQMACKNSRFVFDFGIYHENDDYREIDSNNIYGCEKLIFSENPKREGSGIDLAIVRLDRKVTDRPHLVVENKTPLGNDESVFLIGHPLGLPTKFTDDAVILNSLNKLYFRSDLDAYTGNSGSPVFSTSSNRVKGVLISGEDDFEKAGKGQCRTSKVCRANECDGELVLNLPEALAQLGL